jgi:tetratricopeptide (TPR) repeat protein
MARTVKRLPAAKQDEVLSFFQQLWAAVQRYQRWIILGVCGVLLLVIGVQLTTYLQNRRMQESRAALAQVQPLLSKPEAAEEALKALDQIIATYGNIPSLKEAWLYRAHLLYQLKKYPEAAKAYEEASQHLDGQEGLSLMMAESLSYCYEAMGDFNRAAAVLVPVLDKEANLMQGDLQRRVAWLYEKAGNRAEALRHWKQLLEKPPNAAMVPYLKEKVAALSPAGETTGKTKP